MTCTFRLEHYSPPPGPCKVNTVIVKVEDATFPGRTDSESSDATVCTADSPNLVVKKTGPANGVAGGTGDYQLAVKNTGAGTAPDPIVVTDTLPAGETFVSGTAPWFFSGPRPLCRVRPFVQSRRNDAVSELLRLRGLQAGFSAAAS